MSTGFLHRIAQWILHAFQHSFHCALFCCTNTVLANTVYFLMLPSCYAIHVVLTCSLLYYLSPSDGPGSVTPVDQGDQQLGGKHYCPDARYNRGESECVYTDVVGVPCLYQLQNQLQFHENLNIQLPLW